MWTIEPSSPLRAAPTYKAVTLETILVPEASTSDLVTPSWASLSMAKLLNASGDLTGSSFTSSRSSQHLLQRQHLEQPHSPQQTRQQTRQQQQQRLWKQLVREVMSLSQCSRGPAWLVLRCCLYVPLEGFTTGAPRGGRQQEEALSRHAPCSR